MIRPRRRPEVIERVTTARGELVLRGDGEHHEIISNGVFLMDTRETRSARELARAALTACDPGRRLLLGGLGVGISLAEALRDDGVEEVDVVEVEPAVIRWNRTHLAGVNGDALRDPRVTVVNADLVDWPAAGTARPYDAVCVDTDNGPGWTVTARNARLFDDAGIRRMLRLVRPDGVLAVWSAARAPAFERRLGRRAAGVEVIEVEVPRGAPDVVYLARAPR